MGFPGGASSKESVHQCRTHNRCGFAPGIRNIPWRRAWKPTPVFLPRESHGQKSLVDYGTKGRKESEWLKRLQTHTHIHTHMYLICICTIHISCIVQVLYHLSHQKSPLQTYAPYIHLSEGCSVVSDSLQPHGLYSPWDSQGMNTRVGNLSLLQGIFPYIYTYIVLYIGEDNGNPPQYSCLENPMDRRAR